MEVFLKNFVRKALSRILWPSYLEEVFDFFLKKKRKYK